MFAVCLWSVFLFAACQKQPTWQVQYDLGMRYLTESNYKEAVLAFTAVIEIDPRRAEAYLQLAEAYLAAGNFPQAILILQQGVETTGDAGLQRRLKELQQPAKPLTRMQWTLPLRPKRGSSPSMTCRRNSS